MLVAQPRENNVVSFGGEAEDFGVADISVILEMLSTTLYPDKPKAVAREILCNALDAHVDAGRGDIPVDIIINDQQIEFRDYGLGIAREAIGPVFCTFAGSTKKGKDNQIGGHGIGGKSPFAVTDHFAVTSRHEGMLSTFSMYTTDRVPQHRYVGGRPCEDEGISVIIPLKNPELGKTMRYHVLRVAEDAAMKVRINEELHDFTTSMVFENDDFRITTRKEYRPPVNILYGRVIYPFEPKVDPELDDLHSKVVSICNSLRHQGRDLTISIKAPPSSLATALSRESLSFTDRSIRTLLDCFRNAVTFLEDQQEKAQTALLVANNVTSWTQLAAIKAASDTIVAPASDDSCATLFGQVALKAWRSRAAEPLVGLSKFTQATRSQIAWRQVTRFSTQPRRFHIEKLARVLGPLVNEVRVVNPATSHLDTTRYDYLAAGALVPDSRRLGKGAVADVLNRATKVTLVPSLAAIERERRGAGIYLILPRKRRAEAEALLPALTKLGYEVDAIAEPEIVRTPRLPREARPATRAREWSVLRTHRGRHGSYGREQTYKIDTATITPVAYLPLKSSSKEIQLDEVYGDSRFDDCLQLIAGGPVAYVRQISDFKEVINAAIPAITDCFETSIAEMQARLTPDAFYLALRISRAALSKAYSTLTTYAGTDDLMKVAAAYFPAAICPYIFPSARGIPTSNDVMKMIAMRHAATLLKSDKSRLDKILSTPVAKVAAQIKESHEAQTAALNRIGAILRDARPKTEALAAEVERFEARNLRLSPEEKLLFGMINLNEIIPDIQIAAFRTRTPEEIQASATRVALAEMALKAIFRRKDKAHAA
jgi:hypothetical protein